VAAEAEKKALRTLYWKKFTSTIFSFIALGAIVAVFLVLPSYFFSVSKSNIAGERLEAFNKANPEIATEDLNKSINEINSKLNLISSKSSQGVVSDTILKDLVLALPKGVTLYQIVYNELTTGKTIEIHGRADDRATLRNFKTSLDSNPHIASSELPISDFLAKSNISFKISITMK
jgi:Tfp pilus assembly protein PilN